MLLTTQDQFTDYKISKTLGIVKGNTIRARHVGKDIMAGLRTIIGGEITEYTKMLAESREQAYDRMIAQAEEIGADTLELKPVKEISRNNFTTLFTGGKQAMMKAEPEIQLFDIDPQEYDVIFIGTPVWAWTFAPALRTFFSKYKIEGKNICLLCCHGGGSGKIFEKMEEKLGGNTILGKIKFKDPLKNEKEEDAQRAKEWARDIIEIIGD